MKHYFSRRLDKEFNTEQKDVVQAGVELFYHWKYDNAKDKTKSSKYKEYANGSYREKQELFSKSLITQAYRIANLPTDMEFSTTMLSQHPTVKWATYSVISEIIDIVVPETVMDNFYQFAEVKNVAWGDNLVFNVPNSDLFVVSTVADGISKGSRQRLHGTDVTMTPVNHILTIAEDFYKVISGKVNWGDWVNRVVQSIETQITTDVYNAIFNSFPSLATKYKENGAFAQSKFNALVQRVEAANHGARAVAFGTKTALSNVLPDNQYLQFGLGQEYNTMGFLGNFQGTDLYKFDQRLIPHTDDFAISDNYLLIVSSMIDKLVKIAFEGETIIEQNDQTKNADRSIDYTIQKKWDVKLVTSGKYGIYKFA